MQLLIVSNWQNNKHQSQRIVPHLTSRGNPIIVVTTPHTDTTLK